MDKREQIWKSLADKEYRQLFAEDAGTGLAFQTKLMRENRGWTQGELGQRAGGIKQEFVSQLENPDYGRHSLTTLKKLAAAFDVGLIVRFAPFSELVDWMVDLTPAKLTPPSYEEEARQMSFAEAQGSPSEWLVTAMDGPTTPTRGTVIYLDTSVLVGLSRPDVATSGLIIDSTGDVLATHPAGKSEVGERRPEFAIAA